MSGVESAIGGYFDLELGFANNNLRPWGYGFQSARAALFSVLKVRKPSCVWVPNYICGCIIDPLRALEIEVHRYDIDLRFQLLNQPRLRHKDILLYVNYFGLCDEQQLALIKRYRPNQLIFDHSQAFFTPPQYVLATLYSPRKFVGIPDGGFVNTALEIDVPKQRYEFSLQNSSFLTMRLANGPEFGYKAFKDADERLRDFEPRLISSMSESMLSSYDFGEIVSRRCNNFRYLHRELQTLNELELPELRNAPLCYPLLVRRRGLREYLINNRIFVPTYWPEVKSLVSADSAENILVDFLVPLPCDQRYSPITLKRMVDLIKSWIAHN